MLPLHFSVPEDDQDPIYIELWNYPSEQFVKNKLIDPLSLYLSLVGEKAIQVSDDLEKLMDLLSEGLHSAHTRQFVIINDTNFNV